MTRVPNAADIGRAELRLGDLATFLGVLRFGSIHGAARALAVTPSQVSKAIARLERHLGVRLLVRSSRGIVVSDAGRELAPRFEDLLARADGLRGLDRRPQLELTMAASAFMNTLFLPLIVDALPEQRIRGLDMPPGVAGAYASEPFFDLALTAGNEEWPDSWVRLHVANMRQGLFAAPSVARELGAPPVAPARLAEREFVVPIYSYRGRVMAGDDGCPLPLHERRIGHQTQTLALALVLAQRTDQLVFAPAVAVSALCPPDALVEIAVQGWNVVEPLQLVCHGERVSAAVQRRIVAALRAALPPGDDATEARVTRAAARRSPA